MKRFEFKLQPLLKYRQYLERIAQQKTAKAIMDVNSCENQISELKRAYDQHADMIEDVVSKGVSAVEFRRHHHYLDAVETSINDEKLKKIELKKLLKEKLLELKEKSVDKKAMELYREKLKTRYTQEIIKIEQNEADEITSLKTARTLSNETT